MAPVRCATPGIEVPCTGKPARCAAPTIQSVITPKRGPKFELVALATDNARHALHEKRDQKEEIEVRLGEMLAMGLAGLGIAEDHAAAVTAEVMAGWEV